VSNVLTQGIGVTVGLQKKFDWAGVAVAGVSAGVSSLVAKADWLPQATNNPLSPASLLNAVIPGVAGGVAAAAAQSALTRTDFGDNLRSILPDVIGSTLGNAIAAKVMSKSAVSQTSEVAGSSSDPGTLTPGQMWANALEPYDLNPRDYPMPGISVRKNLVDDYGNPVNGLYAPDGRGGPGRIYLDSGLVANATTPWGAAQLAGAAMEEYSHAAAAAAGADFSYGGKRIETGAALGAAAYLSVLFRRNRLPSATTWCWMVEIANSQPIPTLLAQPSRPYLVEIVS